MLLSKSMSFEVVLNASQFQVTRLFLISNESIFLAAGVCFIVVSNGDTLLAATIISAYRLSWGAR